MSGGGGYKPPPDNTMAIFRLQQQEREQERLREEQRKREEEAKFAAALTAAIRGAQDSGDMELIRLGLDPTKYGHIVNKAVNSARDRVPHGDLNPASYFDGAVQEALTAEESAQQKRWAKTIDTFAPMGFETNRISDSVDDGIIEMLIAREQNNAMQDLDRQMARGALNPQGYEAALERLDKQAKTSRAQLQQMGLGFINEGRSKLTGAADMGRAAALSASLGDSFDPMKFKGDVDSAYNSWYSGLEDMFQSNLEGDLFDTDELFAFGTSKMGTSNSPFVGQQDTSEDDEDEDEQEGVRGLGNAGVF